MKSLSAFSPLVTVFIFTLAHRGMTRLWYPGEDLIKFVNTSEKIWVYNSTETSIVQCKVDVMTEPIKDEMDYYFNRSIYKTEGMNTTNCLFALIFGDKMLVGQCGKPQNTTEILKYQNQNSTCGVFKVSFAGEYSGWYELRVLESLLSSGPTTDCAEYFANRTKAENQTDFTGCASMLSRSLENDPLLLE